MGAEEFMNSSYSLFRNRINLNMWHGYQFLSFEKAEKLKFDLYLSSQATIDLILDNKVIRLRPGKRVLIFDYLEELSNPVQSTTEVKNQNEFLQKDGSIYLNSTKVLDSSAPIKIRSNGVEESSLDNIFIDGVAVKLRPSFSWILFLICFSVFFSIFFFLSSLKATALGISLSIISLLCYGAYIFYFQGVYMLEYLEEDKEDERLILKESIRVKKELRSNPRSVLFIGSSQTFGEGASLKSKRWTSLYCEKKGIENCLNIGIRSAVSETFVNLLEEVINSKPEKIFFILSHNDEDPKKHKENIDHLFKTWSRLNIPVVAVLEPNNYSLETPSPLHYNILSTSRKYRLKTIDPLAYFKLKQDSGWIWWDEVHLTDYGHNLLADFIIKNEKSD